MLTVVSYDLPALVATTDAEIFCVQMHSRLVESHIPGAYTLLVNSLIEF
jgi:hypothetical protein